jgi:hypothetical protein
VRFVPSLLCLHCTTDDKKTLHLLTCWILIHQSGVVRLLNPVRAVVSPDPDVCAFERILLRDELIAT